jgi:hypothetical protein
MKRHQRVRAPRTESDSGTVPGDDPIFEQLVASYLDRDVQNDSGQTWAAGAIANGYVLTEVAGWVRLNAQANHAAPWRPGDVVNEHAFTGDGWVALPGGWRLDPTGRHQFRWWTGHAWSQHALTNGLRFNDPMTPAVRPLPILPPAPARTPLRASGTSSTKLPWVSIRGSRRRAFSCCCAPTVPTRVAMDAGETGLPGAKHGLTSAVSICETTRLCFCRAKQSQEHRWRPDKGSIRSGEQAHPRPRGPQKEGV